MLILKVDYLVAIFFQTCYLLVPKSEICLKYSMEKNSQNSHCDVVDNKEKPPQRPNSIWS